MPEKQTTQSKTEKRPKQTFLQTYRWLTNTWKDAHHLSLLEKCKPKLQWDITSFQSEWPSSKSLQTIKAGKGVEKREHSCTVGGNVNWYSHYGRRYGDSLKRKKQNHHLTQQSHSWAYTWRKPQIKRYMHHIFFIQSSVDGHLGSFHVLAIVNGAVVNTGKYVSILNYGFLWVYAQEWDCWVIW